MCASSPSCYNYGLKRIAIDNKVQFGSKLDKTLTRNFYVDDLLESKSDIQSTINHTKAVTEMHKDGGSKLAKFLRNSTKILKFLQENQRRIVVKGADSNFGKLPFERVLGVQWNIDKDTFSFKIAVKDKLLICRGLLSFLSSVHDALGLLVPFILVGRIIIQKLPIENSAWHELKPQNSKTIWNFWKDNFKKLEEIKVTQCFKPKRFSRIVDAIYTISQMHQKLDINK